jgi:hypothetical protein
MRVQLEQCHELRVHKEACQLSDIMSSALNGWFVWIGVSTRVRADEKPRLRADVGCRGRSLRAGSITPRTHPHTLSCQARD